MIRFPRWLWANTRYAKDSSRQQASLLISFLLTLTGCGLSDQNSFVPSILRQPAAPPPYQEPYPDVVVLARTQGRALFVSKPDKIDISTPLFSPVDRLYAVCARATVPGASAATSIVTIYVTISQSRFFVRRRAEPNDKCEGLEYETVNTD